MGGDTGSYRQVEAGEAVKCLSKENWSRLVTRVPYEEEKLKLELYEYCTKANKNQRKKDIHEYDGRILA